MKASNSLCWVISGWIWAAGGSWSQATAQADFTFAEFVAGPLTDWYPGHRGERLLHSQLIYAGYSDKGHGEPELWYSHGLANPDNTWGYLGVLDYDIGSIDSTYFRLPRPPASLTPPYHLIGLALPESGGILIGSGSGAQWAGRDFNSIFPGIELSALINQVRSDNLQGGPVQALLLWMLQHDETVSLPVPVNRIPSPPGWEDIGWEPNPNSPFYDYHPVWGFDALGHPLQMRVSYVYRTWDGREYDVTLGSGWRTTGYYFVTPEASPGAGALAAALVLLAVQAWHRRTGSPGNRGNPSPALGMSPAPARPA